MNDPGDELGKLDALHERLVSALTSQVTPSGHYLDAETGRETPPDHYGATFTALAVASRNPGSAYWPALVQRFGDIPAESKGHHPFNHLALALLRRLLPQSILVRNGDLVSTVDQSLPWGGSYNANNWRVLEIIAAMVGCSGRMERAAFLEELLAVNRQWTTESGGFIDYPREPGGGSVCTPLTYHAKFVLCNEIALRVDGCEELRGRAVDGLQWLLAFMDDSGICGGFGRSSHALFGYGSLLAALVCRLRDPEGAGLHATCAEACRRIRGLLAAFQRPDGLFWLTPNPRSGAAGGWDSYMYLSVYNAWFAGMLGWALRHEGEPACGELEDTDSDVEGRRSPFAREAVFHDGQAGLLSVRGRDGLAAISTRGQPVQTDQTVCVDLRYGGMLPFHVGWRQRPMVGPPVRVPALGLLRAPHRAGWSPVFSCGGSLYTVSWNPTLEHSETGAAALILATGGVTRAHVGRSRLSLSARAMRRLPWCPQPRAGPEIVAGAMCECALWIDIGAGRITLAMLLHGAELPGVRFLNPCGHTWIDRGPRPACRQFVSESAGMREVEVSALRGGPYASSMKDSCSHALASVVWPGVTRMWVVDLRFDGEPTNASPLRWDRGTRRLDTPLGKRAFGSDAP